MDETTVNRIFGELKDIRESQTKILELLLGKDGHDGVIAKVNAHEKFVCGFYKWILALILVALGMLSSIASTIYFYGQMVKTIEGNTENIKYNAVRLDRIEQDFTAYKTNMRRKGG